MPDINGPSLLETLQRNLRISGNKTFGDDIVAPPSPLWYADVEARRHYPHPLSNIGLALKQSQDDSGLIYEPKSFDDVMNNFKVRAQQVNALLPDLNVNKPTNLNDMVYGRQAPPPRPNDPLTNMVYGPNPLIGEQ